MNLKSLAFALSAVAVSVAVVAKDEIAESPDRYGFSFSAGYAWRSRAKTSFSAGRSLPPGGTYENGSFAGAADWRYDGQFVNTYGAPDLNYNAPLYSMALRRTESIGGGSDDEGMNGLNLAADYVVWRNDRFDVSAKLRFAGYWDLENGASGGYRQYFDHYSFGIAPPENYDEVTGYEGRSYGFGGANPRMRFESDLYQIGFGPQVTCHAFDGWCEWLDWLAVYGGVEILCDVIHADFTAGAASSSDTDCRIGFGGQVGLVGNVTDWFGVYGQIGYEWIDESEVSTHGCSAETDYSSLVLSAGVVFRF